MSISKTIETSFEQTLFASRWIMAPMYFGMAIMLFVLLLTFGESLFDIVAKIPNVQPSEAILGALSLIDLSLICNLMIIIMFSGYENFVSKIDTKGHEDNPEWRGSLDFTSLKMKVIESIVAISGIHLLQIFMTIQTYSTEHIMWMTIIHLVFIISGVLLAVMDRISTSTKVIKKK